LPEQVPHKKKKSVPPTHTVRKSSKKNITTNKLNKRGTCNVTLRCVRATIIAVDITYSECVLVALGMQHTICMRHIIICGLFGSTIFFSDYLINGTIFGKKF
jgi:hypothetical protein